MFFGEEESEFQNLPPEMIVSVMNFVNLEGKKNARSVCRRWRWILEHPGSGLICFKKGYGMTTEDSLKYLLKSQLHIEHLIIENINMRWPTMTYSRNKFPAIRRIWLGSENCEQTVTKILQYGCAETESLKLTERCFFLVRPNILSRLLAGIKWNNLTELSVYVRSETRIENSKLAIIYNKPIKNHAEAVELVFKKATVPNLNVLRFDLTPHSYDEYENSTGITKLMPSFVAFIARHSRTLKGLDLRILSYGRHGRVTIYTNIPGQLFPAEQQKSIARNLKLESLEIAASHITVLLHHVPSCLWESAKLTQLCYGPIKDNRWTATTPRLMTEPDSANPIQSMIQRNQQTLTAITMTFALGYDAGHIDALQMTCLESCPNLEKLTIRTDSAYNDKIWSVKVRLPTVGQLDIHCFISFNSLETISAWITRTFRNLETVQFLIHASLEEDWQSKWVENLLPLPRLREIWFTIHYNGYTDLHGLTLFRQFCHDQPRLIFKIAGREESECHWYHRMSCVIKIIPLRDTNVAQL